MSKINMLRLAAGVVFVVLRFALPAVGVPIPKC
jgi:hypothetical protein